MRRATFAIALAVAACGDGPSGPGPSLLDVNGRVHTLDGGSPAALVVTATNSAGVRTASVAADGTFRVSVPLTGDTIEYVIDAAGFSRTYIPALVRAPAGVAPDLRVVLVPRQWTIDRGSYAGRSVAIVPDAAFRPPCATPGDTNCDGFFPRVWTETGMKLWPATSLPIRLAFDRVRSHRTIAAADSAAFWIIANRMNDDFGDTLFRPARYEDISVAADGRPDRAVLVRVDTTLSGFGAWTNWWWDAAGDMTAGVVRPARVDLLRSSSLMTHELLHTHGFKHSCSWPTVMGGYGCGSTPGLSVDDVAHAHVALRVHALQKQTGAPHGLLAALQGERRVILNQPLFAAPDALRLRMLRSDSIGDGDHAH